MNKINKTEKQSKHEFDKVKLGRYIARYVNGNYEITLREDLNEPNQEKYYEDWMGDLLWK